MNEQINLRDYFAAKALQSYIANQGRIRLNIFQRIRLFFGDKNVKITFEYNVKDCVKSAYEAADQMIRLR